MSAIAASLDDFPDSLSPMVIKELRQGLRTRVFTGTLLLLHVFLMLTMLISSFSSDVENARWVFDTISSLGLCLILPLRGMNAVSDEIKHGTLEMLRLTRLSSLKIIFGKWAAVALLCLLVAFSLLPYLAARYLLGGVELSAELLILVVKFLLGLVFAAVLIALSTIRQPWLRSLLIFVPLFFGGFGLLGFLLVTVRGTTAPSLLMSYGWEGLVWFLAAAWLIFAFLALAASRISPPAEPLSAMKRSVHLVTMSLPFVGWLISGDGDWLLWVFPVLGVLALDAMAEPLNRVPTAYACFFKAGFCGRLLLPILAPGWCAGFWATLFGSSIAAVGLMIAGSTEILPYFFLAACSFWMACTILLILPTRKSEDLLPLLIGTLLLMVALVSLLGGLGWLSSKASGKLPWVLAFLPPTAWVGAQNFAAGAERKEFLQLSLRFAAVWPLALATLSVIFGRSLARVRQQAMELARKSNAAAVPRT